MKTLYDAQKLKNLFEEEEYNSQFFISISAEEHFKPLLDEYLSKVLVMGYKIGFSMINLNIGVWYPWISIKNMKS